mgnify:CR=1 FL=1
MEIKKSQTTIVSFMVAVLLAFAVYSQSGVDPESKGFSRTDGYTALAGGYGGGVKGDDSLIMAPDDSW